MVRTLATIVVAAGALAIARAAGSVRGAKGAVAPRRANGGCTSNDDWDYLMLVEVSAVHLQPLCHASAGVSQCSLVSAAAMVSHCV